VSGEQRPSQQWIVKVSGAEDVSVAPGESIEIGRKPMRPIAGDDVRRLDVPDSTKSMSKRHAVFTVTVSGSATLRDCGSTNGSYIVRNDGGLIRVPLDTDFLLPRSPMRFQFGDVPVDFVKVSVARDDKPAQSVADLFTYATSEAAKEPDAADMSVDDILDLRAGEPTSAFDASSVRSRIHALHDQAIRDQQEYGQEPSEGDAAHPLQNNSVQAGIQAKLSGAPESQEQSREQGLSDAAHDEAESTTVMSPIRDGAAKAVAASSPSSNPLAGTQSDDSGQRDDEQTTRSDGQAAGEDIATGEGADDAEGADENRVPAAGSEPQLADVQAAPSHDQESSGSEDTVPADDVANPADHAQRDLFADALDGVFAGDAGDAGIQEGNVKSAAASADNDSATMLPTAVAQGAAAAQTAANAVHFEPLAAARLSSQEQSREQEAFEHSDAGQPTSAVLQSSAIYEPGSVFERVSQGDFDQHQPVVEVEGMTSDDARNTRDFAEQFEMAKHPELLPFLAMNVALYDDLYAWLSAQGNQDVDTALSKNKGYQEYLAATRK
jgi:hypothetical protein